MDFKIISTSIASLAMVVASAGAAWSMTTSSPSDQAAAPNEITYVTERSLAPASAVPSHLNTGPAPTTSTTTTAIPVAVPVAAPQPVFTPAPTPQPVVTAPPATAPRAEPRRESDEEDDD